MKQGEHVNFWKSVTSDLVVLREQIMLRNQEYSRLDVVFGKSVRKLIFYVFMIVGRISEEIELSFFLFFRMTFGNIQTESVT